MTTDKVLSLNVTVTILKSTRKTLQRHFLDLLSSFVTVFIFWNVMNFYTYRLDRNHKSVKGRAIIIVFRDLATQRWIKTGLSFSDIQ